MALTLAQIEKVWPEFVAALSGPCKWTKDDLRAAAQAADAWADANAASYNAALPAAFRTTATAAEKAALLMAVTARRFLG